MHREYKRVPFSDSSCIFYRKRHNEKLFISEVNRTCCEEGEGSEVGDTLGSRIFILLSSAFASNLPCTKSASSEVSAFEYSVEYVIVLTSATMSLQTITLKGPNIRYSAL